MFQMNEGQLKEYAILAVPELNTFLNEGGSTLFGSQNDRERYSIAVGLYLASNVENLQHPFNFAYDN